MATKKMKKDQAVRMFKSEYLPYLPPRDCPARRRAWNDFIDWLEKSGRISVSQSYSWVQPKGLCSWKAKGR